LRTLLDTTTATPYLPQALASRYPAAFEGAACAAAVEEAAALVSDADVALASLALRFLVSLTAMPGAPGAAAAVVVAEKARGPALALVRSPLLQGGALEVLQSFFAALAKAAPQGGEDALLAALLEAGSSAEASSKQVGRPGGVWVWGEVLRDGSIRPLASPCARQQVVVESHFKPSCMGAQDDLRPCVRGRVVTRLDFPSCKRICN
jgi:hypothetical protein